MIRHQTDPVLLLIHPPVWDVTKPPYTPAYVGSIVRRAGWECRVADLNIELYHLAGPSDRPEWQNLEFYRRPENDQALFFERYRKPVGDIFARLLEQQTFDLFGFSVNLQSRYFSIWAAQLLSALRPDVPVLFGGSECFPGEYGRRFLERNGYRPDLILQGEAEIALVRFLQEFRETRRCATTVRGFCYLRDGTVVDTGEPDLPDLQEGIIADYSQFDFAKYQEPARFSTLFTRGCVNQCAFCNERPHFKRFRVRPPQVVVEEIRKALPWVANRACPPMVTFNDSIFNGNPRAVESLCDLLIASGLKFDWGAQVSFSKMMHRELLEKMAAAGCRACFWGFESASQKVLDAMRKNFALEEAEKILEAAAALGIQNHLPLIVGFPGETPEDILADIRFILKYRGRNGIHFIYVSPIQLKSDSWLLSHHADYGIQGLDDYHWYTADERNIHGVRVFRTFLLLNVIRNAELTWEGLAHAEYLPHMNFDHLPVASEIAWTLYLLGRQAGREGQAREFLEQWEGEALNLPAGTDLAYWRPPSLPADLRLSSWFARDKNAAAAKQRIVVRLLEFIRKLDNSRPPH